MNPNRAKNIHLVVIIDAFRAFATACSILDQQPLTYFLTDQCQVVHSLKKDLTNSILVGKPEIGSSVCYHIPNSPTRAREMNLAHLPIIHRTAAGGLGARSYPKADVVLATSFVNAKATAETIAKIKPAVLQIIPLGHEGKTATLEDDLCSLYLKSLLAGKPFDITPFIQELKEGPGNIFFGEDQEQYPEKDFDQCIAIDSFPFAIFVENRGDFAILRTKGPFS